MKFNLYNVVLVAVIISCSKAVEETSEFDECLEEYLDLKSKFENNSIFKQIASGCRYITKILDTLQKVEDDYMLIRPTITNDCIIRELKYLNASDHIATLQIIKKSESSRSQIENIVKNAIKVILVAASLKCEDNLEFNEIYNLVGMRNVTVSTPEEKYCFAKFVEDEGYISLENVEFNPSGISIANADCYAIIEEKREQFLSGTDTPDLFFKIRIFSTVLDYIELPRETKEAAIAKFKMIFYWMLFLTLPNINIYVV